MAGHRPAERTAQCVCVCVFPVSELNNSNLLIVRGNNGSFDHSADAGEAEGHGRGRWPESGGAGI